MQPGRTAQSDAPPDARDAAREEGGRGGRARELLIAWVHLAVLWSFAFARPLFEVLEDSPEFFVARGNTTGDIVVFALGVTLLPPTLLLLVEAALLPLPRARRALHLAFVGILMAAIVVQLIDGLGGPGAVLIVLALACGAAGAVAYARTRALPAIMSVLAPVPVVVLVLFLFVSPVSDVVFADDDVEPLGVNVRGSTPVVVIVFDEFSAPGLLDRHRRLDASRFPNLAAFARDATWYRNATTVADETIRAVPAILTGSRAPQGRLPTASKYPQSLFTLLGEHYSFDVDEPITDLCPDQLCSDRVEGSATKRLRNLVDDLSIVSAHLVAPEDLEDRLPAVDRTFAGFRNAGRDVARRRTGRDLPSAAFENRVARLEQFADGLDARGGRPELGFLHIALPHVPWQYLPSGQSYSVIGRETPGLSEEHWSSQRWLTDQAYQRYLLQLGFVDRLIGSVLERLRQRGLYDRALVVLTADHGVSMRPDENRRAVTDGNVVDIASVPLFVKLPGQRRGHVDDGPARTLDILPTISEALHVRLPQPVEGRPLPRPPAPDRVLRVDRYGGGGVSLPFREFVRRRDADVRRRTALFGSGDAFADLYAAGPHPELVGRRVSDVPAGPAPGFRAELDFRREFFSLSPTASEVPVFVTARLSGGDGEYVAVAINGRIVGVTRAYQEPSEVRMGALVPLSAFTKGANLVEALAVDDAGRVARIGRLEEVDARLAGEDGDLEVVTPDGGAIAVTDGGADGYIEKLEEQRGRILIEGWATDRAHRTAADRVFVFADEQLVQAGRPTLPRADLIKLWGSGVSKAGFVLTADAGADIPDPQDLRVIAIADGRAAELPR